MSVKPRCWYFKRDLQSDGSLYLSYTNCACFLRLGKWLFVVL